MMPQKTAGKTTRRAKMANDAATMTTITSTSAAGEFSTPASDDDCSKALDRCCGGSTSRRSSLSAKCISGRITNDQSGNVTNKKATDIQLK